MGACKMVARLNTLQQENCKHLLLANAFPPTFHYNEAIYPKCMALGTCYQKFASNKSPRFALVFSTYLNKKIRRGLAQAISPLWLGMLDQPGTNMKFFSLVTTIQPREA